MKDCRYCGNCCYTRFETDGSLNPDGCLFLTFDQKNSEFSCLIYKNNAKSFILISSLAGFFNKGSEEYQKSLDHLLHRVTNITNNNYVACCYLNFCRKKMLYGEPSVDVRISKEHFEAAILFQKKAEEVRRVTPDFDKIVEKLNVELGQTTKNQSIK